MAMLAVVGTRRGPRRCCVCHEVLPPERQPGGGHTGLGTCSPACTRLSVGLPATFDATQPGEVERAAGRLLRRLPAAGPGG